MAAICQSEASADISAHSRSYMTWYYETYHEARYEIGCRSLVSVMSKNASTCSKNRSLLFSLKTFLQLHCYLTLTRKCHDANDECGKICKESCVCLGIKCLVSAFGSIFSEKMLKTQLCLLYFLKF